uniref:Uncharacterized protein MANES_12G108100 n=1 Tax=Rhizophora mucronata TaxID=61149 RepID=A0A2P2QW35_RHIMU
MRRGLNLFFSEEDGFTRGGDQTASEPCSIGS